jgi:hypothetical protein
VGPTLSDDCGRLPCTELHVWSLSESKVIGSVHVLVKSSDEYIKISGLVREVMHHFGIHSRWGPVCECGQSDVRPSTIQPETLGEFKAALGKATALPDNALNAVSEAEFSKAASSSTCLVKCAFPPKHRSRLTEAQASTHAIYQAVASPTRRRLPCRARIPADRLVPFCYHPPRIVPSKLLHSQPDQLPSPYRLCLPVLLLFPSGGFGSNTGSTDVHALLEDLARSRPTSSAISEIRFRKAYGCFVPTTKLSFDL